MAKQPKVSVVVPIYNVEKYLRECVDSILAQTLEDIEVILVDDGSPDKCGEIVDAYTKKDSRVIAVHQKNSGYSKAVNRGIEMANILASLSLMTGLSQTCMSHFMRVHIAIIPM